MRYVFRGRSKRRTETVGVLLTESKGNRILRLANGARLVARKDWFVKA